MKKTLLKNEIGNTLSPVTEMDSVVDSEGRLLPDVLSGYDRKINSATKKADAALSHLAQKADKEDIPKDFFVVDTGMTYDDVEEAYQKHGFKMVLLKDGMIYPLVSNDGEVYRFACSWNSVTIVWSISIYRGIWIYDNEVHESRDNRVTSLSSSSNHFTYPTAKAVYDAVEGVRIPTITTNEEGDTTTISGDVRIPGELSTVDLYCTDDDNVRYNVGNEIRDLKQGGSGGGTEYIIRRWN